MFRHHGMHPGIVTVENGGDGGGNSGDGDGSTDDGADGSREENLGDKGESALRKERERARKAEAENRRLRAAEQELAQLKEQGATAQERAIAEARREAAAEATAKANERILSAEAKAIAGTMDFHNPSRAVALVDLSDVKVDEDGTFDEDAVRDLLRDLAKSDPYLVRSADEGTAPGHRRLGGGGGKNDPEPTDADSRIAAGLRASMR